MSGVGGEGPSVVLAGARGHGRWHLRNIRRLEERGLVRLAGLCELEPLSVEELRREGVGYSAQLPYQGADFDDVLEVTGAQAAVICTPIPTHADLALTAARRGVHVLLEKPPAPSYAEFAHIVAGVAEAGVACQVGFQPLGSHALPAVREMVAAGVIGAPRGIGGAGAWVREESYFRRAPWAGRRRLNGADVVDGALTNPLAHAVATALALDGSVRGEDVARVETELFRAHDIEADDTSCVAVTTAHGSRVTVAATLCAERPGEPYVLVHGSDGRITYWYKEDRVRLERPGHPAEETTYGRTDLLENLLAHLRHGERLLAPPEFTGAFMRVVESVRTAPDPVPLPAGTWYSRPGDVAPRRVVPGIDGLVDACADSLSLFSELGASWAQRPAGADRV